MAKAKKLPSGAWRVQVYAGKNAAGKPQYISITRETEKEANFAALEYQLHHKKEKRKSEKMTVGEAINRYISSKDAILSPSTIRGYRRIRKNNLKGLMGIRIDDLTQEQIQIEINKEAKTHAPKTVRNMHGLLSATLQEYRPDFRLRTKFPPRIKTKIYVPTEEQVKKMILASRGTELELIVLLALCGGLRRSEFRALYGRNFDCERHIIRIDRALVVDDNNQDVEKAPKSYAGDRVIGMPKILEDAVLRLHLEPDERAIKISASSIYHKFKKMLCDNDLPDMRLHDLRHANASVMLKLHIPDKYAAERMGHADDTMLKRVYQHTMSDEMQAVNRQVDEYFDELATQLE